MGVRIIEAQMGSDTALYDSTSGWAFGPVASEEKLEAWLLWLKNRGVEVGRLDHNGKQMLQNWEAFISDPAWVDPASGDLTDEAREKVFN